MTPDKSPHPFPTGGGRVPRLSVHTEYYYSSGLRKEKVGEQAESGRGGGQRERRWKSRSRVHWSDANIAH
jgi:hypothetical protein